MTVDFPLNARPARSSGFRDQWAGAGQEPSLADILADPVVHLIMERDGLARADLDVAIARGRAALRRRLCSASLCCAA